MRRFCLRCVMTLIHYWYLLEKYTFVENNNATVFLKCDKHHHAIYSVHLWDLQIRFLEYLTTAWNQNHTVNNSESRNDFNMQNKPIPTYNTSSSLLLSLVSAWLFSGDCLTLDRKYQYIFSWTFYHYLYFHLDGSPVLRTFIYLFILKIKNFNYNKCKMWKVLLAQLKK